MNNSLPAILGGTRACTFDYTSLKYVLPEDETKTSVNFLQHGNLSAKELSFETNSLINKFKKIHNSKFAIPYSNCTSALFSAFASASFKDGDEIIAPAYSYHATILPALYTKVKVVFVDVEETTLSINYKLIEDAITKNTKAIVVSNMWGIPGELKAIKEICKKNKLIMIEDAARGIGGTVSGIPVGAIGDIGCFSFSTGKGISAGEGGILITNNEKLYSKNISIGHPVYQREIRDEFEVFSDTALGTNHRIHPLATFIANSSINSLEDRRIMSNQNAESFYKMFDSFDFINRLRIPKNNKRGAWSSLAFFYDEKVLGIPTHLFTKALQAEGVKIKKEYDSNILYNCSTLKNLDMMLDSKVFHIQKTHNYPISEKIRKNLLICEGIASYMISAKELVSLYHDSIRKIISNKRSLLNRYG